MRHLDLFSGIGGFAYAADQVWGDVEHIFCDNDKFCRAVLRKHWPESKIYDDIRAITDTTDIGFRRRPTAKRRQAQDKQQDEPKIRDEFSRQVDLLTGGFPCQPFSAAGLRRGTADERHLWPEMFRVVQLVKPTWVIAENVRGLVTWNDGLVLEQVCADLEAAGYEVQPLIIPAAAVNAPHRRDRIWFIAHCSGERRQQNARGAFSDEGSNEGRSAQDDNELTGDNQNTIADPRRLRGEQGRSENIQSERQEPEQPYRECFDERQWERDWTEVAAELCSLDDGTSAELGGLKLSKSQHRKEQLKAYGNAIVPQVAMEIMKAIKEAA